ncbi:hypothetical protein ACFL1H_00510 [Nanoarchaeota archaeon]
MIKISEIKPWHVVIVGLLVVFLIGVLIHSSTTSNITARAILTVEEFEDQRDTFVSKFSDQERIPINKTHQIEKISEPSIHSSKNPDYISSEVRLDEMKLELDQIKQSNENLTDNLERLLPMPEVNVQDTMKGKRKEKEVKVKTKEIEEQAERVRTLEDERLTKEEILQILVEIRANKSLINYHPRERDFLNHNTLIVENGEFMYIEDDTINEDIIVRRGATLILNDVEVNGNVRVNDHSLLVMNDSYADEILVADFSTLELHNSTIENFLNIFFNSYAEIYSLEYVSYINVGDNSKLVADYISVGSDLYIYENSQADIGKIYYDYSGELYVDSLSFATIDHVYFDGGYNDIEVYGKSGVNITLLEVEEAEKMDIYVKYYAYLNIYNIEADLSDRFKIDQRSKSFVNMYNAEIESDKFEIKMREWSDTYFTNLDVISSDKWDFNIFEDCNLLVTNSYFDSYNADSPNKIYIHDNSNFTLINSVLKSYYKIMVDVYENGWFNVQNSLIESENNKIELYMDNNGFIDIINSNLIAYSKIYTEAEYNGFLNIINSTVYSYNNDFVIYNEYGGFTNIDGSYIFADNKFLIEYLYEGGWLNVTNSVIDAYHFYGDHIYYGGEANFNNVIINSYDDIYFNDISYGGWVNFVDCNIASYDGDFYLEDIEYGGWVNIINSDIYADEEIYFNNYEGGFIEIENVNFVSMDDDFTYYADDGVIFHLTNVNISVSDDVYIEFDDDNYIGDNYWTNVNIKADNFDLYLDEGVTAIAHNFYVDSREDINIEMESGSIFNVTDGHFFSYTPFESDVEIELDNYGCFVNFDNVDIYSGYYLYFEIEYGSQFNMIDSSVYAGDYGEIYADYGAIFNALNTPVNLEGDDGLGSEGYLEAYYGTEINIDQPLQVAEIDMGYGVIANLGDVILTEGSIDLYYGAELYMDSLNYVGEVEDGYIYGYDGIIFELNGGEIMLTEDDFEFYRGSKINLNNVDIIGYDGNEIDLEYGIELLMDNVIINLEDGYFYIYDGAYVDVQNSNINIGDDEWEYLDLEYGVEAYFTNTILDDKLRVDQGCKVTFEDSQINGEIHTHDAIELDLIRTSVTDNIDIKYGDWSPSAGTLTFNTLALTGDVLVAGGPILNVINSDINVKVNPDAESNVEKTVYRLSATSNSDVTLDGTDPFTVYNEVVDGTSSITKTGTIYSTTPIQAGVLSETWEYFQPRNTTTINTPTTIPKSIWLDNAVLIVQDTTLTLQSFEETAGSLDANYDIILDNNSRLILINASIISSGEIIARDNSIVEMSNNSYHTMFIEAWFGSYINLIDSEVDDDIILIQSSRIDMDNSEVEELLLWDHSTSIGSIEDSITDYFQLYGFSEAYHNRSNSSMMYISAFSDLKASDGYVYEEGVFIDDGSSASLTNMHVYNTITAAYYIPEPIILNYITFTSTSQNKLEAFYNAEIIANDVYMDSLNNDLEAFDIGLINITDLEVDNGDFDVYAYRIGEINVEDLNADLTFNLEWNTYENSKSSLIGAEIYVNNEIQIYPYYMGSMIMKNVDMESNSYWDLYPYDYGYLKIQDSSFIGNSGSYCEIYADDYGIIDIDNSNFYCETTYMYFYPEDGSFIYADNVNVTLNQSGSYLYIDPEYGSFMWLNNANLFGNYHIEIYPYYLGYLFIDNSNFTSEGSIGIWPEYAAHMEVDNSNFYAKNEIGFDAYCGAYGYMNNCDFYSDESYIYAYVDYGAYFDFYNCEFNASGYNYIDYYYGAIGNFVNNDLISRNSYIYYYLDDGAVVETDNILMDAYSYIYIYLYDGVIGDFTNVNMITRGPSSYINLYAYYFYVGLLENLTMNAQRYVYAECEEGCVADFRNVEMRTKENYSESYAELEYYSAIGDIENVYMYSEDVILYLYSGYIGNVNNINMYAEDDLEIYLYEGVITDITNSNFEGNGGDFDIYEGVIANFRNSNVQYDDCSDELYLGDGVEVNLYNTDININNDPTCDGDLYMEDGARLISDSTITAEELYVSGGSYLQLQKLILSDGYIGLFHGSEVHIEDLDELGVKDDNYVMCIEGVTLNISDSNLLINDSDQMLYCMYGFDLYFNNIDIIGTNDSRVMLLFGGDVNFLDTDILLGEEESSYRSTFGVNSIIENAIFYLGEDMFRDNLGGMTHYKNVDISDNVLSLLGSDVFFENSVLRKNLTLFISPKVTLKDSNVHGSIKIPFASYLTLINTNVGNTTIIAGEGSTITLDGTDEEIIPTYDEATLNAVHLYDSTVNLKGNFTIENLNTHCGESTYIIDGNIDINNIVKPITINVQDKNGPIHNAQVKITVQDFDDNTIFNQRTDWSGRVIFIPPEEGTYEITVTNLNGETKTETKTYDDDCIDVSFSFIPPRVPTVRSGGGGGGYSAPPPTQVQAQEGTPFNTRLGLNEKVEFTIGSEKHSIKMVNRIGNRITFTIQSEPIQITMDIGDKQKFDLNSDNIFDIEVYLKGIVNNEADVEITVLPQIPFEPEILQPIEEKIDEKISEEMEELPVKETPTEIKDSFVDPKDIIGEATGKKEKGSNLPIILILVSIIIIGLVIYFVLAQKREITDFRSTNYFKPVPETSEHINVDDEIDQKMKEIYGKKKASKVIKSKEIPEEIKTKKTKYKIKKSKDPLIQLGNYIKKGYNLDYDKMEIKDRLLEAGWKKEIVDEKVSEIFK